MPSKLLTEISVLVALPCTGCGSFAGSKGLAPGLFTQKDTAETCSGYPDIAAYALPWSGTQFTLIQGNCGTVDHKGVDRYAYDFAMPVGSTVLAARSGTVISVAMSAPNGTLAQTNSIQIRHADASVASYLHLDPDSAEVAIGQYVDVGTPLATSGDNGFVGSNPAFQAQLHFEVQAQQSGYWQSIPISFDDSGSAVSPLVEGTAYPLAPD